MSGCKKDAPCPYLYQAVDAAMAGGTVVCLDAPEGSNFTIERSVTIDCSAAGPVHYNLACGTYGSISGLVVIKLPPGDPFGFVRLRGMSLNANSATNAFCGAAVLIVSAKSVIIEDSEIKGGSRGIIDRRTGGQTRLYVRDATIHNVSGPAIVAAGQSPSSVVLDNVSLLNNVYGVAAAAGNNVVVTRSTISGNTTAGVHADGGAQINVSNSTLSHNTTNVNAFGTVRLKENDIQFSNTAIAGGAAISLGANRFSGNGTIGFTPPLATGAPADVNH